MAIILKMLFNPLIILLDDVDFHHVSSMLSFDDDDGGTSRSGKESTVELFLDELAELELAKVAPELEIIDHNAEYDDRRS